MTEQDLINLREIAIQQKNQRAIKIKNRVSKQTHYIKLAENLSPITKKRVKVEETTQKIGHIMKESNSENETPQLEFEKAPTSQQIENKEGLIYDLEI